MLDQLRILVNDDIKREAVVAAGYKKVHSAGHDVKSRMRVFLFKL